MNGTYGFLKNAETVAVTTTQNTVVTASDAASTEEAEVSQVANAANRLGAKEMNAGLFTFIAVAGYLLL